MEKICNVIMSRVKKEIDVDGEDIDLEKLDSILDRIISDIEIKQSLKSYLNFYRNEYFGGNSYALKPVFLSSIGQQVMSCSSERGTFMEKFINLSLSKKLIKTSGEIYNVPSSIINQVIKDHDHL